MNMIKDRGKIVFAVFVIMLAFVTSVQAAPKAGEITKTLEVIDFSVSDGMNTIQLDSSYENFRIEKTEKILDNNYVGNIFAGDFNYKYYIHEFEDFNLYTSNANYNLKDRNFDEYYITQITLLNSSFKTQRGIAIGSNIDDIINAYGNKYSLDSDDKAVIFYSLNDMRLVFTIDENQKVQELTMFIFVDDME